MKRLIVLGSIFFLVSCVFYSTQVSKELSPLQLICEETQWEGCSDLEEPIIVKSKVVSFLYYGFYYKGEKYIFINSKLTKKEEYRTIIHETVHYVADWLGKNFSKCESEEAARKVTASILKIPYDDSWRDVYSCNKTDEK